MKDASTTIEVNGDRSGSFFLSRSIRQGCPLAPSLFVIVTNPLHFFLRDHTISPKIRGPILPNQEEIANIQFVDDTTILFSLEEENMVYLMTKLDLFCKTSGNKISISKSILLGWEETPPSCCVKFDVSWEVLNHIVRYLGIPFAVSPNINHMRFWVKDKVIEKLNKWNTTYLTKAGRIQVFQKILSS
jgi:hypothetical protein